MFLSLKHFQTSAFEFLANVQDFWSDAIKGCIWAELHSYLRVTHKHTVSESPGLCVRAIYSYRTIYYSKRWAADWDGRWTQEELRQTSKSVSSFRRWKHLGVRPLKEELLILQGNWGEEKGLQKSQIKLYWAISGWSRKRQNAVECRTNPGRS